MFAGKKAGEVMLRGNGRQFRFLAAADRFGIVADNEFWVQCQRAGDADPLTLAP